MEVYGNTAEPGGRKQCELRSRDRQLIACACRCCCCSFLKGNTYTLLETCFFLSFVRVHDETVDDGCWFSTSCAVPTAKRKIVQCDIWMHSFISFRVVIQNLVYIFEFLKLKYCPVQCVISVISHNYAHFYQLYISPNEIVRFGPSEMMSVVLTTNHFSNQEYSSHLVIITL